MLPTPDTAHVGRAPYADSVYDPAEDSFALMDALEADADALYALQCGLCVEIGGAVSAFVRNIVGADTAFLCTDINAAAMHCTKETGEKNAVVLEPVRTSLVDGLRLDHSVDLLLFNPPYVVTSDLEAKTEQEDASLGGALAGGVHGTALLQCIIHTRLVQRVLRPGGRFYFTRWWANLPRLGWMRGLC
ncbi:Mtq2p [Malassezia vespertilionis]|uniref:Mtq2p n=1 Tax=Malassezia vespertilionis TaxID=2020962 RepID=A0A2N1J947_9BASI|nr:Mtq2p [Malassezia vespertilionis]